MEHFISSFPLGSKLLVPSVALIGELCLQSRLHNVEDRWFPFSGFCPFYGISKDLIPMFVSARERTSSRFLKLQFLLKFQKPVSLV